MPDKQKGLLMLTARRSSVRTPPAVVWPRRDRRRACGKGCRGGYWPPERRGPLTDDAPSQTPLSRVPAAEPKAISAAIKAFDSFISHLNVLSSPSLSLLSSPRLATIIHHGGLERVNQAYADIYAAVMDKSNKYEFASTLLTRATDEVAMLLGINDLY